MKYLASLLVAAACSAGAQDLVARQGDDSVRLMDKPCTDPEVIERLQPEAVDSFRAATARFQGKDFKACWRMMGSAAYLVYEDGDQGIVPAVELKPDEGV